MDTLGIVFTGGEGPEPEAIGRLFDSLEAGAITAAADSGLCLAEAAGLKPDWIIGDMDSLEAIAGRDRLSKYPAQRVFFHNAEKDYTDTELALSLLWEKSCDEVWIIGGGGGRTDHIFGIRDLFERERFPRRWITAAEDIFCLEGGTDAAGGVCSGAAADDSLTKSVEAGGLVSVFPLGEGPWKAESRGLKWPLENVHWERGRYGLSNAALAASVTVSAKQGRFLVIFPNQGKEELCRR